MRPIFVGQYCGEKWYRLSSWGRYPLFRILSAPLDSADGFSIGPILIWWCGHRRVRCIHGDEILTTMRRIWSSDGGEVAVVRCMDCEKPLYNRPRPKKCTAGRLTFH